MHLHSWWFKVTFLGWLSDPFKGLSDLQLGDEKVTLSHLGDFFTGSKRFFFPANQLETLGPYQTPTKRQQRRKRFIPFPENHSLGEFPVLHLGCVEIFHIFESWSVVENVTSDEFRYKYLNCKYNYTRLSNWTMPVTSLDSTAFLDLAVPSVTKRTWQIIPQMPRKTNQIIATSSAWSKTSAPRAPALLRHMFNNKKLSLSCCFFQVFPGFGLQKGFFKVEKNGRHQQWPLKMYRYTKTVWGLRHSKGICLTPVSSNRSRYHGFLPSQNFKVWRVLRCCSNHCPVWLYKKLYGVIVDLSKSCWYIFLHIWQNAVPESPQKLDQRELLGVSYAKGFFQTAIE